MWHKILALIEDLIVAGEGILGILLSTSNKYCFMN